MAEALSMLGAGDREHALEYIDRAMGVSGAHPLRLQQGYGYAGAPSYCAGGPSPDYQR